MYLLTMVLGFMLLLCPFAMHVGKHVEYFVEGIGFYCSHQSSLLLLDELIARGLAFLVENYEVLSSSKDSVFIVDHDCARWQIKHMTGRVQLVKMGAQSWAVHVELFKHGEHFLKRTVECSYQPEADALLVGRQARLPEDFLG